MQKGRWGLLQGSPVDRWGWRRFQLSRQKLSVWCRPRQSLSSRVFPAASSGRRRTQMGIAQYDPAALGRPAWNAGRKVGVKKPLKQRQIWAIRFFLDREGRMRDQALFDLAIDSKLRGCDLVKIKIGTLVTGTDIRARAMVGQHRPCHRRSKEAEEGTCLARDVCPPWAESGRRHAKNTVNSEASGALLDLVQATMLARLHPRTDCGSSAVRPVLCPSSRTRSSRLPER